MLQTVINREAEIGDVENIFQLISVCFDEFVAVDYNEDGVNEFYKHINPSTLLERINDGYYTLLALCENRIIGMIQIKAWNHVSLFFTASDWQGKGVGKELLKRAIAKCEEKNSEIKGISVNASPFSVQIYCKLGFKRIKFEQNINGIRFTPMEYLL